MANPVTPDGIDPPVEPQDSNDDAIREAALIAAMAKVDPLEVAAENAQLRSSVRAAYALLHALVKRAGGTVAVKAAEYRGIPPIERLRTELDAETGDVRLIVDSPGHRRGGT